MPLEQASVISQLDEQWPNGGDSVDRGDDHLRLIKSVLKNAFKGPDGHGFSIPLTVDPVILNALAATLKSIDEKITNAHAIGNIIFRDDNVNPATLYPGTTWTLLSGDACIALATVDNVGTMTGSNTPIVPVPEHSHEVTVTNGGAHKHTLYSYVPAGIKMADGGGANNVPFVNGIDNRETSLSGEHTHAATAVKTGTKDATLDVRGQRKYLCAWKRVK